MDNERVILHSDMNSFYASVEMMLNPELKGKPVAVCGSTEERHGIVLAKSDLAKKAGVKTGMVNWEARQLCPDWSLCRPSTISTSSILSWPVKFTTDIRILLNRMAWMSAGLM